MKSLEEALQEVTDIEERFCLYQYKVGSIPIWNILRYKIRGEYLSHRTRISGNAKAKIHFKDIIKNSFISFWQLLYFVCSNKQVDNLVMGFSRLEKVGDHYLDKFIDPILKQSKLKDNYIYFEYGRNTIHKKPRLNEAHIIYLDCPYTTAYIFGIVIAPLIWLGYNKTITEFYQKIKKEILPDLRFNTILFAICETLLQYYFFRFILKRKHIKRVFGVSRILFMTVSLAAKRSKIPVYELQHGITHGPTRLYSGYYNPEIDPDYFLTFGEVCPLNVFGIPENRIKNIGWAFKSFIQTLEISTEHFPDTFLVISEPGISQKIIDVVYIFANHYPEYKFHIRRHPQEQFNDKQKDIIANLPNVQDVSSPINSNIALLSYDFIIGDNSTVLYEALSIGKKVGRINFGGFILRQYDPDKPDGFYYIHRTEDLKDFALLQNNKNKINTIYSDFDADLFNSFLI